jgi:hypothetical protein
MAITVNEFKNDVDRYLAMAQSEDLYITIGENNTVKISHASMDKEYIAKSLFGIIPPDITLEESRDMKAAKL